MGRDVDGYPVVFSLTWAGGVGWKHAMSSTGGPTPGQRGGRDSKLKLFFRRIDGGGAAAGAMERSIGAHATDSPAGGPTLPQRPEFLRGRPG